MRSLKKMFKGFKNEHILGIVGLVVILFALYKYSANKNLFKAGLTSLNPLSLDQPSLTPGTNSTSNNTNTGTPLGAPSHNTYAPYNGATSMSSTPNSATKAPELNKPIANPSDLLPSDANSAWAGLNPVSNSDLQNVNLLNPSQVVGINTQGSSLRNANLQLRSEPPNPRINTNSPWNISTIEDDKFRKSLEIGSGA